jgi:hypothetical protein
MSWACRSPNPPQRPDQPDVPDGVRELRPPRRLEVRKQVELTLVVGAVAAAAQSDNTQGVAAPTERARDQVRRIDPVRSCADNAGASGDPVRHNRRLDACSELADALRAAGQSRATVGFTSAQTKPCPRRSGLWVRPSPSGRAHRVHRPRRHLRRMRRRRDCAPAGLTPSMNGDPPVRSHPPSPSCSCMSSTPGARPRLDAQRAPACTTIRRQVAGRSHARS